MNTNDNAPIQLMDEAFHMLDREKILQTRLLNMSDDFGFDGAKEIHQRKIELCEFLMELLLKEKKKGETE